MVNMVVMKNQYYMTDADAMKMKCLVYNNHQFVKEVTSISKRKDY